MSVISKHIAQSVKSGQIIIPSFFATQSKPYAYQIEIDLIRGQEKETHLLLPCGDEKIRHNTLRPARGLDNKVLCKGAIDYLHVKEDCMIDRLSVQTAGIEMPKPENLSCTTSNLNFLTDEWRDTVLSDVPPISQLPYETGERKLRCSPTNLAMVLNYYQKTVTVPEVANEVYHSDFNREEGGILLMYGIWPMAIYAASRKGIAGAVHCFQSVQELCEILDKKQPVIITVSYEEGELSNAVTPITKGHLITVCGIEGDHIIVNDPLATEDKVRRLYKASELIPIWARKGAVGYVLRSY